MQNRYFHFILNLLIFLLIVFQVAACAPLHLPEKTSLPFPDATTQAVVPPKSATPRITPTSGLKVDQEDLRGVEIQLWQPWFGDQESTLMAFIDEFNHLNEWGITVKVRTIGGIDALAQEVQTAWGSSNLPDLVIAYTFQAQNWQKIKPLVQDWQPYLNDAQWGIPPSEQSHFLPGIWQSSMVAGMRWGIPARRDSQFMFVNQSWANELGFSSLPITTEAFRKQACAAASLSQKDPQTKIPLSGGWMLSQDYPTIFGWITAFKGKIVAKDKPTYQFTTNEVKQAFQYLRQLYEDGCTIQFMDINPVDALAERKALFVAASSRDILGFLDAFQLTANNDRWAAFPIPSPDGKANVGIYGMDYILLQSDPKRQLASWLFVKWMIEPENQVRWSEKTLSLPYRAEALDQLKQNQHLPPSFQVVLDQIGDVQAEPALPSWNTVRWMLSDASKQLFAWYFKADQVDNLLKLLETSANDFAK